MDLCICCLAKVGFSNNDIAAFFPNMTVGNLAKRKTLIKELLGLMKNSPFLDELERFIFNDKIS
jgi:hypothetical protein